MNPNIKKIWKRYDKLIGFSKDKEQTETQKLIAELDSFSEDEKDDEYFYLKGLIHYMKEPSDAEVAQECFQKSLEINKNDGHARLYLGHCFYDRGFYSDAEYHFSLVNKDEFNNNVKDFIQMKVEEMLVCCSVKMSNLNEKSLLASKKIINKYHKLDYLDDYLFNLSWALQDFGIDLDNLVDEF